MKFYLLLLVLLAFVACNRKTVPTKPTHTATTTETPKPAAETATVVVSGDGKVVNSSAKSSTGKVYPVTQARSFTPDQKKNLMYRFKTIPPRVLHVPESLSKKNAQGSYYVLKKKFWYWKKPDGYFYLDENYYN